MLHQLTRKTLHQAGDMIPTLCWSGTRSVLGQWPSLLVFIALCTAGPWSWLAIRDPRSAPVQGALLCFLTERDPAYPSAVAAFPVHADSQPRASRNELPTVSCWEMGRTGLLSLPGRQSAVHEKGCSECCVCNHCPPSSCSLSPVMGHHRQL